MATARDLPAAPAHHPRSASIAEVGWRRTFSTLSVPEYRTLWWGMVASFVAMQMNIVARGYLAYDITGSAAALGVVSLAWGLPMLAFSLFGGVIADRVKKRDVLIKTQAAMGVLALITAVLVHTGLIEIWHLVVLGLGQGTVFAFNMPARSAIIPELVGENNLTNAIALNTAGMNFSRILGPAAAGGLIAVPFVGMTGTFYLMTALYVVVVYTLWQLPEGKTPQRVRAPMLADIKSGFSYIGGNSVLLLLISMAFVPILLGMPYQTLMPVFQKEVFDVGSVGLGLLFTSIGVGALIGSLLIAYLGDSQQRGLLQSTSGILFGASLVGFALMSSFFAALAMVAVLGLVSAAYMTLNNSMIMSYTDEEYYGRVMSVYMMTFSFMPLAAMPMGLASDAFGVQPTVAVAGALIVLFLGALLTLVPGYRRIG